MRTARLGLLFLVFLVAALTFVLPSPIAREKRPLDLPAVLEQVLKDVLNNPALQDSRDFYGTPGDKRVVLIKESAARWPKNWPPEIPGYVFEVRSKTTPMMDFIYWNIPGGVEFYSYCQKHQPRQLAIRLDKCNLEPWREYHDAIDVCLFNSGGDGGETTRIGAAHVTYTVTRQGGKLIVKYNGHECQ